MFEFLRRLFGMKPSAHQQIVDAKEAWRAKYPEIGKAWKNAAAEPFVGLNGKTAAEMDAIRDAAQRRPPTYTSAGRRPSKPEMQDLRPRPASKHPMMGADYSNVERHVAAYDPMTNPTSLLSPLNPVGLFAPTPTHAHESPAPAPSYDPPACSPPPSDYSSPPPSSCDSGSSFDSGSGGGW